LNFYYIRKNGKVPIVCNGEIRLFTTIKNLCDFYGLEYISLKEKILPLKFFSWIVEGKKITIHKKDIDFRRYVRER